MCFQIFQNEKTLFQAIKIRSSKNRKIAIFPKGLVHGFRQKVTIFPSFFFGNTGQENVCYDILERKNLFLSYKNNKFKKWKNCHFSKGISLWFWSKIDHFSIFFFNGNTGQENVFYDILEGKNVSLSYKNKKFKKWKNCHFSKGVNPLFWSKIGQFSMFFLKVIQARKMCFTIFQNEKTSFQAIKTRSSKSGKIAIFPKGLVYGFGQKLAIFPSFSLKVI